MSSAPEISGFIRLLTQYQPALFGFVRAIVPNVADAEDILQETNIALWEKADKQIPADKFLPYAMGVARHKAIDHIRRKKKLGGLIFDPEIMESIAGKLIEEADPDAALRQRALDGCLEEMSAQDRQLLTQRYQHGRTIRDLVPSSGKTETTLQYHFARMRAVLRDCIEARIRNTHV